jgi:peptide-methionine (S)-S-oxide reductase
MIGKMTKTMNILCVLLSLALAGCTSVSSSTDSADLKQLAPAVSEIAESSGEQTAVFAGGCFWGVEAVFESLRGVKEARSGYAGGSARDANYGAVSDGTTKHAEAVSVTYDPKQITYSQLLAVFFTVAHDPTQLNRQGPDIGPQYRSAIFFADGEQKRLAEEYIAAIDKSGKLKSKVVTEVVPLEKFYDAEAYHQNYLVRNPTQRYIVEHDMPKLEDLKNKFPELYVETRKNLKS